ncbi:TRAP transporter substrate-binding protein [Bordetella petrii]|uniref:TRAP transporter substrate-binding protein n=1 Tax=Bordetella petrii TaxID=94624 RepID=UPI001E2D4040|nr:TRAP transporter substrate-binding protein [Bordetella petrii]MCD0502671.1 TRAP transporter substrate-binding protein [Bordetella petrii]
MNHWRRWLAGALGALALATAGTAQAAQQVMRIQTAVPNSSMYFELMQRWGQRIQKMSDNRLKVEILPDGAVVAAFEILDAVDKGIVEGGYAWTHYWSGKHPAAGLFSNPMAGAGTGLDQISHVAWLYEGGGNQLLDRFYHDVLKADVEVFMLQPMGPDPLGWFKAPIASVADFQRLKYRSPPGITGEIFKEMGVSAVALPGGEIVPAAQRGVIDAAEWIGPADDVNLGLQTIWKNYYLQGLHQSTDVGEVLINRSFWNTLPDDLKEIVRVASLASIGETYTFNVARNARALEKLKAQNVTVRDTPQDFYPAFVKATNTVLDRYAAKDPFFKEVLDSQRQFGKTVVPYWTKILDLYAGLGHAALKDNP